MLQVIKSLREILQRKNAHIQAKPTNCFKYGGSHKTCVFNMEVMLVKKVIIGKAIIRIYMRCNAKLSNNISPILEIRVILVEQT